MIALQARAAPAVSRRMLALSACLHAAFILAMIYVFGSVANLHKPAETSITRVKLVETKSGPPELEQINHDAGLPAASVTAEETLEVKNQHAERVRETVTAIALAPRTQKTIPLTKRKRNLQRIESAEPKESKKPEEKAPKKKQEPEEALEKRLAALRKDVESKKKSQSSPAARQHSAASEGVSGGSHENGALVDEELMRWMRQVRGRINSHWALFGEGPVQGKVTVIGVRIGDDGALLDASVEQSSGDPVFDRSAMRAVFQAAPFPPTPPTVKEKIQKAGGLALRFTPAGLQ